MLSENIKYLRKKSGHSQEKLAELLGVTRQAVQKWEKGTAQPDTDRLIGLSRLFGVTTDALLNNEDADDEKLRFNVPVTPKYDRIQQWEAYYSQLLIELRQCIDEGKDVQHYKQLVEETDKLPNDRYKKELADVICDMLSSAPPVAGYKYREPSELQQIKLLCKGVDAMSVPENIEKRIAGAWLGRICGCVLGKPVECMKLHELVPFLKENKNYPMHRYVLTTDVTKDVRRRFTYPFWIDCFADTLECCPVDDDTNYTIMASLVTKKYGRDFTADNVAEAWIDLQVKNAYCTAERVAYKNIIDGYAPPETAIVHNPYREWIGAQIRADYYGYINPGDPVEAANAAFRDASVSHVKNGIYGAMFAAAAIAAAACVKTPVEALEAGLACVPSSSRLWEYVSGVINDWRNGASFEDFSKKLNMDWDDREAYDWCHVIPNAAIVAAALLYGRGDYGKTICLAVQSGFDTDCNGATAGSICGMMFGEDAIGEWAAPIHGAVDTTVGGTGRVSLCELTERTLRAMKNTSEGVGER